MLGQSIPGNILLLALTTQRLDAHFLARQLFVANGYGGTSIRDIADATREQSVATNEMARSAEEVNRMTAETDVAADPAASPTCTGAA